MAKLPTSRERQAVLLDAKATAHRRALALLSAEFGFKCREKNMNLEETLARAADLFDGASEFAAMNFLDALHEDGG